MPSLQPTLPGLFGPAAQTAHLATRDCAGAIRLVATTLLSAVQECGSNPDTGKPIARVQNDKRFKLAVCQAVALSIGLDDQLVERAKDRCALLYIALRRQGSGGVAGMLGRAAMILGQVLRAANDDGVPEEVLQLIEAALIRHRLDHGQDLRSAQAAAQLAVLNRFNAARPG